MTYPPELEKAARAMYETEAVWLLEHNRVLTDWAEILQEDRDAYCQAFAAGLAALLPVTAEIGHAAAKAISGAPFPSVRSEMRAIAGVAAAITYLIGREP
jgi:hypothetical protein